MGNPIPIVGIGASAGGVEALRGFFTNLPVPNNAAFVVLLHLSPDRASMLAEVLGRWTAMPVVQATDGIRVEAGHVYAIPPNLLMTIEDGRLRLRSPTTPMRENAPIDIFFASLAAERGPAAIGVVLSGTGSDGALGLKLIKERGGIALAQGAGGSGPQYSGMPASAIATGAVDLILPVEAMPNRILQLLDRDGPTEARSASDTARGIPERRSTICAILRNQIGHDFSGYKEQTFARRVQRRMDFLGLDVTAYMDRLRTDAREVVLLFHELLIGVTAFFRDTETFRVVEQTVIPRLFEGLTAAGSVRVWVPGCSTGEEAYSLAILLREYMSTRAAPPKAQIFATDIDEAAVNVARMGRYPALLLQNVDPERMERFFVHNDGTYQVRKELRDICTFSTHSVIRDPPFSRMDLISCRNLLIYLDSQLQAQLIPAFHYSLRASGILWLGGSEMITRHGELFTLIDKKHRIFQRRNAPSPPLQVSAFVGADRSATMAQASGGRLPSVGFSSVAQSASSRILDRFAPPFVVVNASGEVLHFSSRTGKYLEAPAGMPSTDIVSMARPGLRLELRAALRKAIDTRQTIERGRVQVELNAGSQPITLTVEPMAGSDADPLFLVVFSDAGTVHTDGPTRDAEESTGHDATIEQIERELRNAREQLQSTAEEYETALEELKSANEELHSVNEELQSTNEELETSKEELQSMNEELQTVNDQLSGKLDELDHANADLRNLFESTQVATVFVDRFMIIRSFTPAVAGIYNLIPADQGRPLSDIASHIDYHDLRSDVARVLATLKLFERRVVRLDGGTHYLMRILPYRAADNRVDGALITFVDVTSVVQAEQHHRLLVDELNHRVRNMLTVVISLAIQTLKRSRNLEEFSDAFMGRLNALAAAYTLLTRDRWTEVPLRDVLLQELQPFLTNDGENVVIAGDRISLKPRGALAFGMIVHEFTTNAVKHGALSVPGGKLTIRWEVEARDGGEWLVWNWIERDGPPVTPRDRRGFGLMMIERSVDHELKGNAQIAFDAAGLRAMLAIPLAPGLVRRAVERTAQ